MKNLISFLITSILLTPQVAITNDEIELLCSKALLSGMKDKGLLNGTLTGVCVQSLNDLPQVNIGLGSNVYASGYASGKSLSGNDQKIRDISSILTGQELNQGKFEIHGYADGQNNLIKSYTEQFLGTKKTFTKADIRRMIKDGPTSTKILELLQDTDDKTPIEPVWSSNDGKSFNREAGKNYHPNINRVMSLVNNYYLAVDRAVKTCEQLVGSEATEEVKSSCLNKVSGHPSPATETQSQGKITCDARRKAVLVLNPKPKTMRSTNPSRIHPNFQIPSNGDSRRDMQVAATLDLFKKISSKKDSDPNSVIEILATQCSGGKTNDASYQFNKQNLTRMYNDILNLANKTTDTKLKSAVQSGNYKAVKKILDAKMDEMEDGKLTNDDPSMQLLNSLTWGVDRAAQQERLSIVETKGAKLNCSPGDLKRDFLGYDTSIISVPYKRCTYNSKIIYIDSVTEESTSTSLYYTGYDSSTRTNKIMHKQLDDFKYVDSTYPNAARSPSSTDVFNCLSASAAIEENLKDPKPDGSSGDILDPVDLIADAQGKVSVSIPSNSLSKHGEDKGWMCDRCHSGIHVKADANNKSIIEKRSRENAMKEAGNSSQKMAPVKEMGLTFGSMKNLAYRKVTRESFGTSCPAPKNVCDCLKKVGDVSGGLDGVISKSEVVNLGGQGLANTVSFNDLDKKNSCFYAPPVAPSCSVAPSGKGADNLTKGMKTLSCRALTRFLDKYPDKKALVDTNYKDKFEDYLKTFSSKSLSTLQCKNVFPSDNDAKDCKWNGPPGQSGSSGSSSATKQ